VNLKRIIRLLRYALGRGDYRRQWFIIIAMTLLGSGMTLLSPWPMKILVDNVLEQLPLSGAYRRVLGPLADSRTSLLAVVVLAGLLLFAVNSLSDLLLTRAWVRVGQGMVWDVAADLYARLQRRSLAFHSCNQVGDSMARITGDSWCVHTLLDTLLFAPATALVMSGMMLVVMLRIDVELTLLAVAVAPFMALGTWMLSGPIGALARARRELDGRLQSHVQQTISGIAVVQAFTQEQREHDQFRALTERAFDFHRRASILNGVSDLANGFLTAIGTAAVLLVAGERVLGGRLTVGLLLVYLGYLVTLQSQIRILASTYSGFRVLRASLDRVMEVLEVEPEIRDRSGAHAIRHKVKGHVTLENVTFGYRPQQPVLIDVSLEAQPGERIGIVGPTGAGKSTLVSLIPRLFDPWQGRVTLDGRDVRDLRLRDVRRSVALVLQEAVLFPVSIAENIAYGRPEATRNEVIAAADAANAHGFIRHLERGYDTVVGQRGATLSGGERQRIAVARALLMDAPILILDEPTSNLDSATESQLLEAIDRLMVGRTTLVIAHRLATIRDADRIIVIDAGTVAEQGSHESLLWRRGPYWRLHDAQYGRSTRQTLASEEVTP
jgi:ATP-binding cassette subfamily B protein/subfamily B ATP-binding cassette protein MsbA